MFLLNYKLEKCRLFVIITTVDKITFEPQLHTTSSWCAVIILFCKFSCDFVFFLYFPTYVYLWMNLVGWVVYIFLLLYMCICVSFSFAVSGQPSLEKRRDGEKKLRVRRKPRKSRNNVIRKYMFNIYLM